MAVVGLVWILNGPAMANRDRGLAYLRLALGEDQEDLQSRSPAYNADKIKAEVLLIHGARDERAPIE